MSAVMFRGRWGTVFLSFKCFQNFSKKKKEVPATCGNFRGRNSWRKRLTANQPILLSFKKYSSFLHKIKQPLARGMGYGVGCRRGLVSLGCVNGCEAPDRLKWKELLGIQSTMKVENLQRNWSASAAIQLHSNLTHESLQLPTNPVPWER